MYTLVVQYVSRIFYSTDNKHNCIVTVLVLCSTCCEELSRLLSISADIIFFSSSPDLNLGQHDATSNKREITTCITVKSHYTANRIQCRYDYVPTRQKLETCCLPAPAVKCGPNMYHPSCTS